MVPATFMLTAASVCVTRSDSKICSSGSDISGHEFRILCGHRGENPRILDGEIVTTVQRVPGLVPDKFFSESFGENFEDYEICGCSGCELKKIRPPCFLGPEGLGYI
jgi:hypothetical protein